MTLGASLKYCRTKADLTQREVNQLTGINYKTLSNWENDVSKPSPDDLIELANIYHVTVDYLLGRGEAAAEGKGAELSEKKIDLASYINSRNELYYNGTTYKMDDQNKEKLSIAIQVALATMDKDKK